MLIEDPDALKPWLVQLLKPMCEADPEALAKYVMALVKKDKPEEELRKSCLDQLDVFLQSNTPAFVETFFKAVQEKSYLNHQSAIQSQQQQQQQQPLGQQQKSVNNTTSSSSAALAPASSSSSGATTVAAAAPTTSSSTTTPADGFSDGTERRITRRSSRSPSRKGGGSSRRTDDRRAGRYDRKRGEDRDSKAYPASVAVVRRRSTTRSRSRSLSPASRRKNRSRSPVHEKVSSSNNRSSNNKRSASKSPDREVTKQRKERCRDFDGKGFCLRGDLCPFDHGTDPVVFDPESFLSHRTQGSNAVPAGPALLAPPPGSATGGSSSSNSNNNWPEYDPRNPGIDVSPVLQSQRPALLMPSGPMPPHPAAPSSLTQWVPTAGAGGYVPSSIRSAGGPLMPSSLPSGRPNLNVIIPDPAAAAGGGGGPGDMQQPHGMHVGLQSTVTVVNNHHNNNNNHNSMMNHHMHHQMHQQQQQQQAHQQSHQQNSHNPNAHMMHHHHHHQQQQQQQQQHHQHQQGGMQMHHQQQMSHHSGRGGRGGGRGFGGRGRGGRGGFGRSGGPGNMMMMMSTRPHDQPERCTLEVRRLPPNLNTITCLNEYFSKFGTIVNLQIKYENDPEAAVVQFASHAEAAAANQCPDAVLGSRFIKLFWHNKDQERMEPTPEKQQVHETADDRQQDREDGSCENNKTTGDGEHERSAGGHKDDADEDRNRIPVKERLDLKPVDLESSFKLPKPKPSRPVLNPNLLRKSNLDKGLSGPVGEVIVPMIKTRSEQKKEKLLKNIEIRKKTESLLDSLRKDQGSIADKMMTAKTKEERSSLKRLFDVLDLKRKKVEEDLKRISEELLHECGAGRGGSATGKKKHQQQQLQQHHHQQQPILKPHVAIIKQKDLMEEEKKFLDLELDQISESNRKVSVEVPAADVDTEADAEADVKEETVAGEAADTKSDDVEPEAVDA